jgi:hypothetical protein
VADVSRKLFVSRFIVNQISVHANIVRLYMTIGFVNLPTMYTRKVNQRSKLLSASLGNKACTRTQKSFVFKRL